MRLSSFLCLLLCLHSQVFLIAQSSAEELRQELNSLYKQSDLPGFAVSLLTEDRILFQAAFGFSDVKTKKPYETSTLQNLGSVSKTLTGLALVKLIELGKIKLENPINDYLPFEIHNPYFPDQEILIKQLANHSSSISDSKYYGRTYVLTTEPKNLEGMHTDYLDFIRSHEKMDLAEFLKKILHKEGAWYKKKNFIKARPGSQASYANLNAALVALIVQEVSGLSFQEFCQTYIFDPLEMNRTTWSFSEESKDAEASLYFPSKLIVPKYGLNTYPDGGLVSSIQDLNKFLMEIIKAFKGESTYLKPAFAQLLLPGDSDAYRVFWGMGEKSRNIGHRGSDPGAQTDLQFNADSKIGRIILCNVNAEDNEKLWQQYEQIHKILAKYEQKLAAE